MFETSINPSRNLPGTGIKYVLKTSSLDPDRWGTIASTICAIHCAITGIAVSVLSIVGFTYLQSPILEWGFLGFALLFGGWAAVRGFSRHRSWTPIAIFVAGFVLLAGSHLVTQRRADGVPTGLSELFSVLGGVCLVGFHYINRLHMKSCGPTS